jgi:5'-nucleotidase / UDP-sugar diphosphatase
LIPFPSLQNRRCLPSHYRVLALLLALVLVPAGLLAERVPITILQMNDVYELMPMLGGREGGLARVATLRQELVRENRRTLTLLGGDLVSPSALGTARNDGEPLAGAQMIDVMNLLGLDFATFGNHEFDLNETRFLQRLAESHFRWISSNVRTAAGQQFPNVPSAYILHLTSDQGRIVRVAFIGLTIDNVRREWVSLSEPIAAARRQVDLLGGGYDILIAVTHLPLEDDVRLALEVPEIDLIIGGHEHENFLLSRGQPLTPISKADANARTVWVHRMVWDTERRNLAIDSDLVRITDAIPDDPAVAQRAARWVDLAFAAFRAEGFEPEALVAVTDEPLEGREEMVRNRSTNLSRLITDAVYRATPGADLAIYNGGSIRIDDVLPAGPVTQYDVVRILPFGELVATVEIRGDLLLRLLDQGEANRGRGSFLHHANVTGDREEWLVGGEPVDVRRIYVMAISAYLMTGQDQGLEFLTPDADGIGRIEQGRDVRLVLIDELTRRWPATVMQN